LSGGFGDILENAIKYGAPAAVATLGLSSILGAGAGLGAEAGVTEFGGPSIWGAGTEATGGLSSFLNNFNSPPGLSNLFSNSGTSGMDWIDELLSQTGELGQSASALEGGFNAAVSNAPWWSSLPTELQNLVQGVSNLPPGSSTAARSLLSKVLGGTATSGDLSQLLGTLASTGLGVYGANQQSNALEKLAEQYMGFGAPYRDRLAASYQDPAGFLANSPDINAAVDQGTSALARSLSVNGNPAGSGRALQELQNYATQQLYGQLGNERNRLANFGGLSNFNAAAPGTQATAIGQQGNVYNALGYGLGQLTQPQNSLTDLMKAFGITGLA